MHFTYVRQWLRCASFICRLFVRELCAWLGIMLKMWRRKKVGKNIVPNKVYPCLDKLSVVAMDICEPLLWWCINFVVNRLILVEENSMERSHPWAQMLALTNIAKTSKLLLRIHFAFLMGIPLCVICCFSLAVFNICSLCLIFVNLINICLGVFCLGFILFGTLDFLELGWLFPSPF